MKKSQNLPAVAAILAVVTGLFLAGCSSQVETVVIEDNPKSAPPDSLEKKDEFNRTASFKQLRIGEVYPVISFDPLFALNPASKRAINLSYEGLVRLNQNGKILPAIAKRWEITSDSLSYKFILKQDIFFHDSDVFVNGLGRRVVAEDVSFVFHRMAEKTVPPNAAQLFMKIEGFEPYYQEQRNTYLPENRKLDRISGISVPNDSTVIFNLIQRDHGFLTKLASPFAAIYPHEAVDRQTSELHEAPLGSGPFQISSSEGDSVYIFKRNKDYRFGPSGSETVRLNRVDIIYKEDALDLIRKLANKEVDLIAEFDPKLLQAFLDSQGDLKSSFNGNYQVLKGGTITYHILYNRSNNLGLSLSEISGIIKNYPLADFPRYIHSNAIAMVPSSTFQQAEVTPSNRTIFATLPGDPYIQTLYMRMSTLLNDNGIDFKMLNTTIPNSNVQIYSERVPSAIDNKSPDNKLFNINISHIAITDGTVRNFHLNSYYWWLDLRNVDIKPVAE